MSEKSIYDKANELYRIVVGYVTNWSHVPEPESRYRELRSELLANPLSSKLLPPIVRGHDDLGELWKVVTSSHENYKERRSFLWSEFSALLSELVEVTEAPLDDVVSEALKAPGLEGVFSIWIKALGRRSRDPEGAITISRALLETTCKHILDYLQIEYPENIKLPRLYRLIMTNLSLAPDRYQEDVFKQILGGAQSIVNGLASVRNRLSDAHGKGSLPVKPSPRHAELAVNISGSISSFLIQTYLERKSALQEIDE
jgi:hypothetical protein